MLGVLLLIAAAPPPPPAVKVHVHHAVLFAPGPPRALGSISNMDVRLGAWLTPTRVKIDHKGSLVDVAADIDLAQEHTYVVASVPGERVLANTDPWMMVVEPKARLALVGNGEGGLELAFRPEDDVPVTHATLPRSTTANAPDTKAPVEKCVVKAMHPTAEKDSVRWEQGKEWKVHRDPKGPKGWRKAWAEANGITVHGFVADKDVKCPAPKPGKPEEVMAPLAPTPISGEGTVQARETKLPAGTRLYATPEATALVVVLHKPVRALQREDGSWLLPPVLEGKGELEVRGLFTPPIPNLALGPPQVVGIGSTFIPKEDWPRRKIQE